MELEARGTPTRGDGLRHGQSLEGKMGRQRTVDHAGEHLRRQKSKSHDPCHKRTGKARRPDPAEAQRPCDEIDYPKRKRRVSSRRSDAGQGHRAGAHLVAGATDQYRHDDRGPRPARRHYRLVHSADLKQARQLRRVEHDADVVRTEPNPGRSGCRVLSAPPRSHRQSPAACAPSPW
jgi:hypothetical protein